MVSVLNNYGGFYQRKVYVNEARKDGGNICLPCVNRSELRTSIDGTVIYLGFDCLQNLEGKLAATIPAERHTNGPYTSLQNFVTRTGIGLEQTTILIRCGALLFYGTGKKEQLWEAHYVLGGKREETARGLFPQMETASLYFPNWKVPYWKTFTTRLN